MVSEKEVAETANTESLRNSKYSEDISSLVKEQSLNDKVALEESKTIETIDNIVTETDDIVIKQISDNLSNISTNNDLDEELNVKEPTRKTGNSEKNVLIENGFNIEEITNNTANMEQDKLGNDYSNINKSFIVSKDATEVGKLSENNTAFNTNEITFSNKDNTKLTVGNTTSNLGSNNELGEALNSLESTNNTANLEVNSADKKGSLNKSSIISNDDIKFDKLSENNTLNTNIISCNDKESELTANDNEPDNSLRSELNEIQNNNLNDKNINVTNEVRNYVVEIELETINKINIIDQQKDDLIENELESINKNKIAIDNLEISGNEVNITEEQAYKDLINKIEVKASLSTKDIPDSKKNMDNAPNFLNFLDNDKKENDEEDDKSNELSSTEKQALKDLIDEIEGEESLTTGKNTSGNVTENSSKSLENTNIASKTNMEGNKDNLTNNNNNKHQNKSLNAENSCSEDDDDQKSSAESSTESVDEKAVDIKCEVDCEALLDDVKDEIIDDDYNIPDNFMELAEHFLKNEARVVLQRVVVYKCPECPRVFTSSGQRALHKAKHISEQVLSEKRNHESADPRFIKRHECPECDMRFVQESTLETHMAIHRPFPNICECGIGYIKLTDLQQHEELVHKKTKVEPTYKSTWKPVINLKKTKRSEINRKRKIKEPEVKATTPEPTYSRYGRTQKRFVNIKEEESKLEYSSEDLDDETMLQPTTKKAKYKPKTPEEIQEANERLIKKKEKEKQVSQNKANRAAIRNATKGPITCSICKRELKTYSTYEVHLLSHGNLKSFKCEICGKGFNSPTGLRNHRQTHLEAQYKCAFCDKKFNSKQNRDNHENIHMRLKQYVCRYCDKSFTDPSAWKRHERIHTGVKPYKCQYCPKAFSDASAAIVHRRRHKGEKKFACKYCDKRYIHKGNKDVHEQLHVNDFKFECDLCSATFQLKQYVEYHIMGKHGFRPRVKCSICSKEVTKYNMDKHKLAVHGVKIKKKNFRVIKSPVECEIDVKLEVSDPLTKRIETVSHLV